MKKWMFLLLAAILLTACGQTNGKEQEAMYVNITAQEAGEFQQPLNFHSRQLFRIDGIKVMISFKYLLYPHCFQRAAQIQEQLVYIVLIFPVIVIFPKRDSYFRN